MSGLGIDQQVSRYSERRSDLSFSALDLMHVTGLIVRIPVKRWVRFEDATPRDGIVSGGRGQLQSKAWCARGAQVRIATTGNLISCWPPEKDTRLFCTEHTVHGLSMLLN